MFVFEAPESCPGYDCADRKLVPTKEGTSFLFGNDHFEGKRNEEDGY